MHKTLILLTAVIVSACASDEPAFSEFASVVGTGSAAKVDKELSQEFNGHLYYPDIGGVAFLAGIKDESVAGYSGMTADVDVGAPLQASAQFSGEYSLYKVIGVHKSSTINAGLIDADRGYIDLTANFATGKLWGGNIFHLFKVNGDISGKTLGGFIRYEGVEAQLDGQIGQDGVVAAFQGNTETKIVVGGMVALPK